MSTNHFWNNYKVSLKKIDISIEKKPQATTQSVVVTQPVKETPSKPWTNDEIMFVVIISLGLLAAITLGLYNKIRKNIGV